AHQRDTASRNRGVQNMTAVRNGAVIGMLTRENEPGVATRSGVITGSSSECAEFDLTAVTGLVHNPDVELGAPRARWVRAAENASCDCM
ncbi:MAG: hypothetical protein ACRDXB_23025, partial [Actinomycetes bacterium]